MNCAYCGQILRAKMGGYINCPKHGLNPPILVGDKFLPEPNAKPTKQRIPKYSGYSKTFDGFQKVSRKCQ